MKNKAAERVVQKLKQSVESVITEYAAKRYWVAYSGGVDSHVLLHVLAQMDTGVSAIHIDHGLHPESKNWAKHCAEIASELNIPFVCLQVDVNEIDELGMEAAARKARYQALADYLQTGDMLLTAQHQHDQAETLLLQLLRGAGPKGLAAMAVHARMGTLEIVRPFLLQPQREIIRYAKKYRLNWIDDPSNVEIRWSRNYIRHKIWPKIEARWPAASETLSRSAKNCAQASELLAELAEIDLHQVYDEQKSALSVHALLMLSPARQNNLLRHVLQKKQFPLPSAHNLQRIIEEVCLASNDSCPVVCWDNVEVRRFQDRIYIMRSQDSSVNNRVWKISSVQAVELTTDRRLVWKKVEGEGLAEEVINDGVTIRFREGGERIRLQGRQHHHKLKHLFQQWAVPPWQRDRIPLIFKEDKLIAVVGYAISHEVVVKKGYGFLPVVEASPDHIFIEKSH